MRRRLFACLAATALLATAACTGPSTTDSGTDTNASINVYLYQEPAGLFGPLAPSSGPDNQVMSFIHEGLLGVDPDYKLQPRLAESFEVSDDAKTFTFKLRKGVKWSDGTPFTTADIAFAVEMYQDPDYAAGS